MPQLLGTRDAKVMNSLCPRRAHGHVEETDTCTTDSSLAGGCTGHGVGRGEGGQPKHQIRESDLSFWTGCLSSHIYSGC